MSPMKQTNIRYLLAHAGGGRLLEGSAARGELSTLKVNIMDGSIQNNGTFHAGSRYHGRFTPQKRTFHAGDTFHGRFSGQGRTFHAEGQYRGWFDVNGVNPPCWKSISWMVQVSEANLPRWRSISWMVQYEITEPSTLRGKITDGSGIP